MTDSISALRKYPDMARQIGLIIADYAILEYQVFILYALLSPKNPMESFRKFYTYISANNKCGLVLGEAKQLDHERYAALDKLLDRFKKAANRRTEIAHCEFLSQDEKSMLRLRLVGDQPKFEPLNDEIFQRTTNQYRILSTDVSAFLTILAPSEAVLLHTMHALPRAPHLETLVGSAVPDHQTKLEKAELIASLTRQKLLHLLPDFERKG